jgi:hypothetical protein
LPLKNTLKLPVQAAPAQTSEKLPAASSIKAAAARSASN